MYIDDKIEEYEKDRNYEGSINELNQPIKKIKKEKQYQSRIISPMNLLKMEIIP